MITKNPTPYDDLNAVLETLVTSVHEVLGDTLVATYLQGSFAVGDFDRDSDVDYTMVVAQPLTEAQVEALQAVHERVYQLELGWAQHLEGSYFPLEVLRDYKKAYSPLWYLDNGSRALVQDSHCNTMVVRWVVREKGIALWGPPPATLVDPVPANALRQDILSVILGWGEQILENHQIVNNRFYQSFVVLNYSRMLHNLHTGTIGSKRQGAEWAKAHLDPQWHDLIDHAWTGRPTPELSFYQLPDPEKFARTLDYLVVIMEAAKQFAAEAQLERIHRRY